MQVQRIQNNNYNTAFGERLIFDKKLTSRATKKEKEELAYLQRLFKDRGADDSTIEVNNDNNTTVKSIIEDLYSKFHNSNSERIKSRKIEDAFGDDGLF